jgi:hypothetical protein
MTEQSSDSHPPRLDEELAHEVEGELLDEPEADYAPMGHIGEATGDDRDPDYREERARIGKYLSRTVFPASGARIAADAKHHNAPDEVLETLGRLNSGHRYANAQELWKSLGLSSASRF